MTILWIIRLLLAAVFIYASIAKIGFPEDFADAISAYQILPDTIINILALGLPLFELICGLLVIAGSFIRVGLLGILLMLSVFVIATIQAQIRGLSIHCGCFGANSWLDSSPWVSLLRDIFLFGLSALAYKLSFQPAIAAVAPKTTVIL